MTKSKRCGYSYQSLREIAISYGGYLVDSGQIDIEEAKRNIGFLYKMLEICEADPKRTKIYQTNGHNAMMNAAKKEEE